VRCIKPNHNKAAFEFDNGFVSEQLRYLGVLETVRVRRMGFSEKIVFGDFVAKYKFLVPSKKHESDLDIIEKIEHFLKTKFIKGSHKIFLTSDQSQRLRVLLMAEYQKKVDMINKIQAAFQRYRIRKTNKIKLHRIAALARLSRNLRNYYTITEKRRRFAILKEHSKQVEISMRQAKEALIKQKSIKENIEIEKPQR
jgi:myosin heavy subunit